MPRATSCEICGAPATHHNDDGDFCDSCHSLLFFTCTQCGNEHRILARHILNGCGYCSECYNEHIWTCANCGGQYERGRMRDVNGQHLCPDCWRSRHRSQGVCGYHHHSYQSFHDNELRLGFELETGSASERGYDDCINALVELKSERGEGFYMETDSSIPDWGFETISKPYKLADYRSNRAYWSDMCSILKSNGLRASKECGLHIHASRRFMPTDKWVLAGWFIISNQSKFESLARRESTHYAYYSEYDDVDDYDCHVRNNPQHYDAVNFGSEKPTIEFRMFASTTNVTTLFEDLELIDALCRFVKSADSNIERDIKERPTEAFAKFKAYVLENNYQDCINLINRKGV